MSTIAIDLDNTLYNFEIPAREAFLQLAIERNDKTLLKGAYNAWGEWRSMTDSCGDDVQEEVIQMVHHPDIIREQTAFKGAADVCRELWTNGWDLLFITNRNPDTYDATAGWLQQQGFPTDYKVDLICTRDNKIPLVAHCQYMIDDRPRTLVQFVHDFHWKMKYGSQNEEKARKGFGLVYPFNQALTDVPDIYLSPTWNGIRHYLIEKGVLNAHSHSIGSNSSGQ